MAMFVVHGAFQAQRTGIIGAEVLLTDTNGRRAVMFDKLTEPAIARPLEHPAIG